MSTGTSKFRGARPRTARRPQNRRNDMLVFCRAAAVCATKLGPLLLHHASVLRCGAVFIDEEVADGETLYAPFRYPPEAIAGQFFAPKSSPSGFESQMVRSGGKKTQPGRSITRPQLCSPERYFKFCFYLGDLKGKYERNEV